MRTVVRWIRRRRGGPAVSSSDNLVFRGGTVLTMDASCTVLTDADVLVVGDRIEAVGRQLEVPEGTREIDARGGIVMPGMIDTHRHMWQTAMRGYGADWTLTQYFVWYYLEHGRKFRPEDIAAGNRLPPPPPPGWRRSSPSTRASRRPSTGRTTSRRWSTPRPRSTPSGPSPAGSSSPTATSRPARGSGPPTPRCASSWSGCATPTTTGWASRSPSTSPATPPSRKRPPSRWPAISASP